ncbi:MAG: DUF4392 domain-containing protein [Anaerolineaceae bacterium]|nr:DUF4392 domain-containing protein [Anaerolineaceae bacterium]
MKNITIEDIVLRFDRRKISQLRAYLPEDSYFQAAKFVLKEKGPVIIATGFYVSGMAETDGPPGALAIAYTLKALGYPVVLVGDTYCNALWDQETVGNFTILNFPISNEKESTLLAKKILKEINPVLLISVERCGQTQQGVYRNMDRSDITAYTARLDHLFRLHERTIGIGDGGNEIGMGLVSDQINMASDLCESTVIDTTHLLIASVSNWGAYGLVTAISELSGQNFLLSPEKEWEWVCNFVKQGATAGISGKRECMVDGYSEEINGDILRALHGYLAEKGLKTVE